MMLIDTDFLQELSYMRDIVEDAGASKAVVTGGAIRDMLFERPIKDIDIFYEGGALQAKILVNAFSAAGLLDEESLAYEDTEFTVTHAKLHYYDTQLVPVPIQLIKVENIKDTIKGFPLEFCKNYLDDKGLHVTEESLTVFFHKSMMYNSDTNVSYLERLQKKYFDYAFHKKL